MFNIDCLVLEGVNFGQVYLGIGICVLFWVMLMIGCYLMCIGFEFIFIFGNMGCVIFIIVNKG